MTGYIYDTNGNVLNATDLVTGTWSYNYDALNRLTSGTASAGYYAGLDLAWAYDNFGNRESQTPSGSSGVSLTQPGSLTFTAGNNRAAQFSYDSAGHVQTDFSNSYLYDAEGRICAVNSTVQGVTLYLYDAEGRRVGRGSGSFNCNPASNGFALTHRYVLDLSGAQVTELDGSGNWLHTNAFANGALLATYSESGTPLSFALSDWVGTKRVQAKADGERDTTFLSLPFGDQLVTGTGSTEQFYTGQQRDSESGNDYFNARSYASAVGRFLSPDPSQLYYADPTNPQSFNLYSYALNNPLKFIDPTGMGYCFYGGAGDTPQNDSDPSDYDFTTDGADECQNSQGTYENDSDTTITVNGNNSQDNCTGLCEEDPLQPVYDQDQSLYYARLAQAQQNSSFWTMSPGQRIQQIALGQPTPCGGGAFVYGGRSLDAGPANGFAGGIIEADSNSGISKGALFEAGGGEGVVGGGGQIVADNGNGPGSENLAYGGAGVELPGAHASVGGVGFDSGIGVYGDVSAGGKEVGAGAYLNITTNAECMAARR